VTVSVGVLFEQDRWLRNKVADELSKVTYKNYQYPNSVANGYKQAVRRLLCA
jgi:hypothetical protein